LTARLEDADLKNLAAESILDARERNVSNELVEHTLGYFRQRRELRRKAPGASPALTLRKAPDTLDQAARDRLRQATELHRQRVSRTTLK